MSGLPVSLYYLALIASLNLVAAPLAQTSVGLTRGRFEISAIQSDGVGNYTILYSYPNEVYGNSNMTITLTMEIERLTGLKLYLIDYGFGVSLLGGRRLLAHGVEQVESRFLYQGSHWGPLYITMPINASAAEAGGTQSMVANVSISFFATVWHDFPTGRTLPDSGSKIVGTVLVINQEGDGGKSYIILALTAASVTAIVTYVGWQRLRSRVG